MAVGDVYQLDALYSVKGEKCANVFHFRVGTDPSSAPELSLAGAFETAVWGVPLKAAMSNDASLQTIRVRRIDPTAGGPVIKVVNEAGTVASDTLPPNSGALISWYTSRFDRRGRGRTIFTGVPKTFQEKGLMTAAATNAYEDIRDVLLAPIAGNGGTWSLCIWNRTDAEANDVNWAIMRSHLLTLRGRRMAAP